MCVSLKNTIMASQLSLTVDRKSVSKGDSVTVSWTSELPDSLVLVIDDGDTVQRVQVPDSGNRICWTNRAQNAVSFTLISTVGSRKESVTAKVKVKGSSKSVKPSVGGEIGKFQLWKEKMQARLAVSRAQFSYAWASMKKWQKLLWIVMWTLPLVLLLTLLLK